MQYKLSMIGWLYQNILRPVLFLIDPETVHNWFLHIGEFLGNFKPTRFLTNQLFYYQNPKLIQKIHGITFSNPVGLAAGFDKDVRLTQILPAVGFGFMEGGTVTLNPYQGNPPPRLYRLPKSKGIVVYFGLKNTGVDKIINFLKSKKFSFPLGISVGKTNSPDVVNDRDAIDDYYQCLKKLHQHNIADYYTINISCPNTYGGEPFTTTAKLDSLLKKISSIKIRQPIFLKMPINLSWKQFKSLLDVALKYKMTGVIIGNLNKNRQDKAIKDIIPESIQGGVSGLPTKDLSNRLISQTYAYCGSKLVIVGVGGIFSASDAYEKIKRGATLVQLITGMIYQGPQLISQINQGLVELLEGDGFDHISQAIGSNHKS